MAVAARAATLDGVWGVTITRFGEPQYQRVTLQTSGEKVTGVSGGMTIEGTEQGDAVTFKVKQKDGKPHGEFKGTMLEGVLIGTAKMGDRGAHVPSGVFERDRAGPADFSG